MKAGAKNSSGYGLRRLFWRGMLEHAILRWESATLLSFALLSAAAGWTAAMSGAMSHWTWPAVPLICLAGEAVLIWTSLRDPDTNRVVVSQLLLDTYRPQQLADPELSHRVMVALDLRARIEALTRNSRYISQGPVHAELALQFDRWFGVICELASQLDRFKSELGFSATQARGSAERARDLEKLAAVEVDPTTSHEIAATIAGHEALLDNLYQVRKAVERADLRLERSVSQLANIHAQVVLLIARGPQVDSVRSLSLEIAAEIDNLRAMARAMNRAEAEPERAGLAAPAEDLMAVETVSPTGTLSPASRKLADHT